MQTLLLPFRKVYQITDIHGTTCARLCLCVWADKQKHSEKQTYLCSIHDFSSNWPNHLQIQFVHGCHRTNATMMTKEHRALGKQNKYFYSSSVAIRRNLMWNLMWGLWGFLSYRLEMAEIWTQDLGMLCLDGNRGFLLPHFLLNSDFCANSNRRG